MEAKRQQNNEVEVTMLLLEELLSLVQASQPVHTIERAWVKEVGVSRHCSMGFSVAGVQACGHHI